MKCGARVAIGVAGGYFLGRTKKMKLALMLGGMAAGRRAGGPGELLGQGTKLLRQSPELSALTDQVRGRLLDAGKGAVMAVAARQVESLTDRVGKRVESLGNVGTGPGKKTQEPEVDEPDDTVDEVPDDEAVDADEEPEPPPRRTPRRRSTSTSARNTTKSSPSDSNSSPAPKRRSASTTAAKSTRSGTRKTTAASGSTAKSGRPARARRSGTDD